MIKEKVVKQDLNESFISHSSDATEEEVVASMTDGQIVSKRLELKNWLKYERKRGQRKVMRQAYNLVNEEARRRGLIPKPIVKNK